MNDLNNFDTISKLDDTVTRLECGIGNLAYMLELMEGRDYSPSMSNALHGSLFYLDTVQESLRNFVDSLYHARREVSQ